VPRSSANIEPANREISLSPEIRRGMTQVQAQIDHVERGLLSHPSAMDANWRKLEPHFTGRFQVPTLRNVDKRPYPGFVRAYGHNGYFLSVKEIVYLYNTRDVLPRCKAHVPGEGKTCWPPPGGTLNQNITQVGNLHLTDADENAVVAVLKTLPDSYFSRDTPTPPSAPGRTLLACCSSVFTGTKRMVGRCAACLFATAWAFA
jgi:cytochrome c peroxidase